MPSIDELTGQDATDLAAIATANGAAKDDLSNVTPATGRAALSAAKTDLSNVTPATGLAALGAAKNDLSNVTAATGRAALSAASLAANAFTGDQAITGNVTLTSTDAGATLGPLITLDRNSASPAASDTLGGVVYNGRNSSAASVIYARIVTAISDATAASEDGVIQLQTIVAGAFTNRFFIGAGLYVTGVSDPGTGNIAAVAYYIGAGGQFWSVGSGSPESVVTAPVGSLYSRTDGGATTSLYVKTSGAGNTGWTAK